MNNITSLNLQTSSFRRVRVRAIFAALAFFICFASAQSICAVTYTVTTIADSGAGSLRQAVLDANATAANDVIVFNIPAASCDPTTGVCTIKLTTGEIIVTNNGSLTIQGTGANRLTISGNNANRIFYSNAATFTLSGATLTNGNGAGATNNGNGGAIYAIGGTLALRGVNITGNTVSSGGVSGGVYFSGGANHQITNSTISNNNGLSGGCGGFYNNSGGTLTVTNTTVSGNMTTGVGGGICSNGTTTVRSSTIAGNTGGNGGGFYTNSGALNIGNSIVAGNTGGANADINNPGGNTLTAGYNLIGNNTNVTTAFPAGNPNANNDIVGTSGTPILAQLAPLANYGGRTPTQALCTAAGVPNASCTGASPAIDKGSLVAGVFSDGRGVIRPFDNPLTANASGGNGADIGAFELQNSIVKDWGLNGNGQLGLGDLTSKLVPTTLAGFNDITQFGGGFQHSVALRSDGTVLTAGDDTHGQLGDGTIGGGNRTTFGQVVLAPGGANLSGIVAVSGGGQHSLALKSDGTVWAWGRNINGQLGNGANMNSAVPVQVGAGIAAFNTHVVAVSAGTSHSLALTDDGKVWAWGFNNNGQLGDGTTTSSTVPIQVKVSAGGAQLSNIEQISAGEDDSVALTSGGLVLVWGCNMFGEVGDNTTTNAPYPTQTTNTLMGTIVQISAGTYHNVAVNTLGDVYAWGQGGFGQIGDNNTADALVPRKSGTTGAPLANIVRIEAHDAYQTLARRFDGTLFVWGTNFNGPIGNGTTTNQTTPLNISGAAGTGGNLGTNIAVFGAGRETSFAATLPEIATPAGANTLRGDNFSVAFPASTVAGTTQIRAFDPTTTGLTVPSGYTIEANSTGYDITSTVGFTGNAQVCLKVSNVIDQTTFNKLTILHDDNFDGTLDAVTVTKNYQKREVCRVTQSFSPFVLAQGLAPTAANVSVGGRVTVGKGSGLLNATVQIILADGETRTTRTGSFGYFSFDGIQAGQTVIVSIISKKYSFAPQVVSVAEDLTELNFIALE